ncbi:hypothetical protein SNEBB_002046 [Seison nebaliae]|nr:hypothetical protein SNEBB_002046 [Seison nebaliae]
MAKQHFVLETDGKKKLSEYQKEKAKYFFEENLDIDEKGYIKWNDIEFYIMFHITPLSDGEVKLEKASAATKDLWTKLLSFDKSKKSEKISLSKFYTIWYSIVQHIKQYDALPSFLEKYIRQIFPLFTDEKETIPFDIFRTLYQNMELNPSYFRIAMAKLTENEEKPLSVDRIILLTKELIEHEDPTSDKHFFLPGFYRVIMKKNLDQPKDQKKEVPLKANPNSDFIFHPFFNQQPSQFPSGIEEVDETTTTTDTKSENIEPENRSTSSIGREKFKATANPLEEKLNDNQFVSFFDLFSGDPSNEMDDVEDVLIEEMKKNQNRASHIPNPSQNIPPAFINSPSLFDKHKRTFVDFVRASKGNIVARFMEEIPISDYVKLLKDEKIDGPLPPKESVNEKIYGELKKKLDKKKYSTKSHSSHSKRIPSKEKPKEESHTKFLNSKSRPSTRIQKDRRSPIARIFEGKTNRMENNDRRKSAQPTTFTKPNRSVNLNRNNNNNNSLDDMSPLNESFDENSQIYYPINKEPITRKREKVVGSDNHLFISEDDGLKSNGNEGHRKMTEMFENYNELPKDVQQFLYSSYK